MYVAKNETFEMVIDKKYKKIGQRIREERDNKGLTQEELANKLQISRQKVYYWEKGEKVPTLEDLIRLCDIFGCELGYLLCEFDCKTKEISDIQALTGLSEEAIRKFKIMKSSNLEDVIQIMNLLLEHEKSIDFLKLIYSHIYDFNRNNLKITDGNISDVAKMMNCKSSDIKKYMSASSKTLITSELIKIIDDLK